MSQRGSFVTEYIYCEKCLEVAKKALLDNDKYLCSRQLPSWEGDGKLLPIISGKLGGLYIGEELSVIRDTLKESKERPCCSIKIVVLPESDGVWVIEWGPNKTRVQCVDGEEC